MKLPSYAKVSIAKAAQSLTATHMVSPKIYVIIVWPTNTRVKGTKSNQHYRIRWEDVWKQEQKCD